MGKSRGVAARLAQLPGLRDPVGWLLLVARLLLEPGVAESMTRRWRDRAFAPTPHSPEPDWPDWQRLFLARPAQRSRQRMFRPALQALWRFIAPMLERSVALIAAGWERATAWLPQVDTRAVAGRFDDAIDRMANLPAPARALLTVGAFVLVLPVITAPMSAATQGVFFGATFAMALAIRTVPGYAATILMICLSCVVTARYLFWRLTETMNLQYNTDYLVGVPLLIAELYTVLIMVLSYLQTAWPLHRSSAPLAPAATQLPTVDVYIPTYNEPLAVVRPAVLAALAMDWPAAQLRVYLLDDGKREEMRELAAATGINYITREFNRHAKAGNLNNALAQTSGEYIAIFDCDHLPTRSFLKKTMGWFEKDPRCALVQTPHNFFSPDPFEKNFNNFRRVPAEGELFYGLVQDGNDLWNATFFCGSCAVIRRGPLEEIGGIAVETVTEDAHTSLRLHRRGYTTAYINEIQASGLATESLAGHIGQRIRWARGMAQIFRLDNPLTGKGLTLFQRLCYSNAMLHFFYGIPRLIFLTAPLCFLFFEMHIINADALVLLLFALPHIVHSNLTNSRIQAKYRYSFWASVYESVLAWYIVLPTTLAFFNPRMGRFNVTAKGGLIKRTYYDWGMSKPYLLLATLNLAGFAIGIGRLLWWNTDELGSVVLNMLWTTGNVIVLGAAIGVAAEARQVRSNHRVPAQLPVRLRLDRGEISTLTRDFSLGGISVALPPGLSLSAGERIEIVMQDGRQEHVLPASVATISADHAGLDLRGLSLDLEAALIRCTFSQPRVWADWRESHAADQPLHGLVGVLSLSLMGYVRLWRYGLSAIGLRHVRPESRHAPSAQAVSSPTEAHTCQPALVN